jgi:hypothetical protein
VAGIVGLVSFTTLARAAPDTAAIRSADARANEEAMALHDFLTGALPRGSTVILGPSAGVATWPYYGALSFEPIPSTVEDFAALNEFMLTEYATLLVVTPGTVEERAALLGPIVDADGGGPRESALPAGWRLVNRDPDSPGALAVLRAPPLR